ncbi:AraC family transcriptional regulator [Chromohalobacter israelensis]|uniref:Transcriptional regulator, AraC family n=1 Tax=Chromohalobacter israelensis (strain ATCC BAA-138 / DSM 3043 / CIP 106854 / NCIMB 13768 / 1H11) TaxID=290398 RepID=Q1QZK4_CHRI1|nr:helix-turn-helix transcriptional regulator [Chromohalobacter salexigens]ABE58104.1 transcriptional regulator, AraC family [Chromohalobacter salexigens DSM 3043]
MTAQNGQDVWHEDILDDSAIAVLSYPIGEMQRDQLHSHGYHQIAMCEQPGATLLLGSQVVSIPWNGALLVPSGTDHALTSETRCVIRCIYFKAALPSTSIGSLFLNRLTKELIKEISTSYVTERSRRLMEACLYDQIGQLLWSSGSGMMPPSRSLRVICKHIFDTPEDDTPVATLAKDAGLSERSLRRLARDELGCTISQIRTRCRIYKATQLLQAGVPVKLIAADVGYQSNSAFFSAFREIMGMSPARFQAECAASRSLSHLRLK